MKIGEGLVVTTVRGMDPVPATPPPDVPEKGMLRLPAAIELEVVKDTVPPAIGTSMGNLAVAVIPAGRVPSEMDAAAVVCDSSGWIFTKKLSPGPTLSGDGVTTKVSVGGGGGGVELPPLLPPQPQKTEKEIETSADNATDANLLPVDIGGHTNRCISKQECTTELSRRSCETG